MFKLCSVTVDKFTETLTKFESRDTQIRTAEEEWCLFKNVLIQNLRCYVDMLNWVDRNLLKNGSGKKRFRKQ